MFPLKNIIPLFAVILLVSCFGAKKNATAGECASFVINYDSQVRPIIDANCASTCHSAKNKAGGIDLSTYENVKAISGKAKFLGAIKQLPGFVAMPKKAPKLSDSAISTLSCWVANGSPK